MVRYVNGYPVRISDLGRVEVAALDERSVVRFNGRPAVALGVIKQATANPLELSKAIREELPRITADLPEGVAVNIAYDSSVFIDRSIKAVARTILEAIALVALVIFVFLRSVRATIVPLVTIPVSLVGAFALMYLLGFSINTLTLLALVLAIGLVVDDAIVMLENIWRHIEEGMPPFKAALLGSKEIGFAVVAMTLTLASVYAPVAFMTGRTGKLFIEFALTLAGAVLVSGFVALTLSPMMCSKLLRRTERHGRLYNWIEGGIVGLTGGYRSALGWALRHRALVLGVAFVIPTTAIVLLFGSLKQELAPTEDRGVVLSIFVAPEGATIQYTDGYAVRLEKILEGTADVTRYFVVAGFPHVSQGSVVRRPQGLGRSGPQGAGRGRRARTEAGRPAGRARVSELAAVARTEPAREADRSGDRHFVELRGSRPGHERTGRRAGEEPRPDQRRDRPQAEQARAAGPGRPRPRGRCRRAGRDRRPHLETMLGGRQVTRFKQNGEQYDVIVQMALADRTRPNDISDIFVRGRSEAMVPLANLCRCARASRRAS